MDSIKQIEVWKPILGYADKYEISSLGRVRSLSRTIINNGKVQKIKERILKQSINNAGYMIVGLYDKGKGRTFGVHRLMANNLIPNPENKPEVNHINEIKTDNRVENLEWVTKSENQNHATINKRRRKSHLGQTREKLRKGVNQYTLEGVLVKRWGSVLDIEKSLGFYNSNIVSCCKGRIKHAYGYLWNYNNK